MAWTIGAVVLALLALAIALQVAIARNGPAVLSALDQLSGGTGGAELKATVSTGDHPHQKLLVWGPEGRAANDPALPVLLFVHGGSWRSGDPVDYGFIGRAFVPKGFVVILSGYRLEEAGAYPAMLEDTASAIGWIHREIEQYGGDPERIVVAGHSAGAYNVVTASLHEHWLESHGLTARDISAVIGLSGPYDFYPFDSDSTKAAFGEAEQPHQTQPVNHVDSDAPPMLLIHGEKDDLVGLRNSRELARRIEEAGGSVVTRFYPDMNHNDPLISLAEPWRSRRDVADLIAQFAQSATSGRTVSVPVQDETR